MKPLFRHLIPSGVFAAVLTACVSTLFAEPRDADSGPKGVVELFTSQGCSSCPPADRLLTALARDPAIIAVSFPVDYWDYIGWKDTLASPAFSARQRAYASARGDGHVYTPQIVVNGHTDVVGSDKDRIEEAIGFGKDNGGALSVPIRLKEAAGVLRVEIGAGTGDLARTAADVLIMRVAHTRVVAIERGENKGRSITYTNVVRAMRKIGEWHGEATSFDLTELKAEGEGYVVFLQQGTPERPGTILAAAKGAGL